MRVSSLNSKVDVNEARAGSMVIPAHGWTGFEVITPDSPLFSTALFIAVGCIEADGSIRRIYNEEEFEETEE